MKICKECNIEKSFDNFYKEALSKDGYRAVCKVCRNIKIKESYVYSTYGVIDGKHQCTICTIILKVEEFPWRAKYLNSRRWICKSCTTIKRKQYGKRPYVWNKNKERYMMHQYGIDMKQYNIMFELQHGLCAICKMQETKLYNGQITLLAVDHDHKTNKVRGLLCHECNTGLGMFSDNIELLNNAILYLQNK